MRLAKTKRARPFQDAPVRWFKGCTFPLELVTNGPLNLPFAEERTASRVHCLKRWLEGGSRSRWCAECVCRITGSIRRRDAIERVVFARDLCAIEDVKAFDQELKSLRFLESDSASNAQIQIPNLRQPEAV